MRALSLFVLHTGAAAIFAASWLWLLTCGFAALGWIERPASPETVFYAGLGGALVAAFDRWRGA